MAIKYLMDENVNPLFVRQLRRKRTDLMVWAVGEPSAPAWGTLDPEILVWCEENDFILVTNNRRSMPVHLAEHINNNRHIPGIFILNPGMSIREIIEELILIADFSLDDEYQDKIIFLPLL